MAPNNYVTNNILFLLFRVNTGLRTFFNFKRYFQSALFVIFLFSVYILTRSLAILYHFRRYTKKNVPWHILAPSAVACDNLHLRTSAHLRHVSAFLCNREFHGISYCTKKQIFCVSPQNICFPCFSLILLHSVWQVTSGVFLRVSSIPDIPHQKSP